MSQKKVFVTGASGLLGRAIVSQFRSTGWNVTGAAFSRSGDDLIKLDLRDPIAIDQILSSLRPDVVVHSAAERRPDICESDPTSSEALNIESVWTIGRLAAQYGAAFVLISTDYLFDGTKAPYSEDSPLAPLNAYGCQKARGEYAARAAHPGAFVLRVPVLFGPTVDLTESAVTTFAKAVQDSSRPQTIDNWQVDIDRIF